MAIIDKSRKPYIEDNNTNISITAGQGVFVGYLNQDSAGMDTRIIQMTIWTNPV